MCCIRIKTFVATIAFVALEAIAQTTLPLSPESEALLTAVYAGNSDLAAFALENGADPDTVDPRSGLTVLSLAVSLRLTDTVYHILRREPRIDALGARRGYTALMHGCSKGDRPTLRALLDSGADARVATADRGITALMLCASRADGYSVTVDLIGSGADVSQSANDGWTALMAASDRGRDDVVELLLLNQANPNAATDDGRTALQAATLRGHHVIVDRLLRNKADPNIATNTGDTPLLTAAANGNRATVVALLEAGAHATPAGVAKSPLAAAVQSGDTATVRALLDHGADPDVGIISNKHTPLMLAANRDLTDIVVLLLAANADPNRIATDGWTSLEAARMSGATASEDLIRKSLNQP